MAAPEILYQLVRISHSPQKMIHLLLKPGLVNHLRLIQGKGNCRTGPAVNHQRPVPQAIEIKVYGAVTMVNCLVKIIYIHALVLSVAIQSVLCARFLRLHHSGFFPAEAYADGIRAGMGTDDLIEYN